MGAGTVNDQHEITLTMAREGKDAEWAWEQLNLERRIHEQVDTLTTERNRLDRKAGRDIRNKALHRALRRCYGRLYRLTAEATQGEYRAVDVDRWARRFKGYSQSRRAGGQQVQSDRSA